MEDLRSSRRQAKPAYGDVFCGGAHKYSSTPSTAKSDDYAEIFGGVAASCSIPFLDLPPPSAEHYDSNGGGPIDYSEIFGGFNGGNFAVDYEDLFKKTAETSAASNGRVRVDAEFGQHADGSDFSPVGARKDYGACSENNNFSSSSNYSDDGSKQFSMSFHRTTHGSIEDVISGKTHITQLHSVPGYTYMVNSCSSQDVKSDNSPNIQTIDLTDACHNERPNDLEQEKRAPPTSSTDYASRDGADLRTHQKEYSTKFAASEDDPVNGKYHSRSSSNYSASSGDIPYPDVTYVSISEINLRTQPSTVPPPSRPPPKLASKQEHTKSHQIHYRVGAFKSHGVQGVAKDVEVDASSAAAASAAAMKEAMEQAQARLKSAKELMVRKRDNLQSRKKLGHKEGSKYDDRKEVMASVEETPLSEVPAKKPLPKVDKGVKDYTLDDMQKVIKVGKVALDHEERERYVATAEQSRQMRQGNGFKSSQMSYKSEEVSGEWKTEEQFYELINSEKFRAVKEASKQEDVEKNTKTSRKANGDKENGPEMDELANEFRRTVQLHKVNETIQWNEIDDGSKACNMSHKEEIRMTPENVPGTCILKENRPEDIPSSLDRNGNKKVQASEGVLAGGEELKKPNAGEETLCGENEINMASSNNALKFEEIYHDNEGNRKQHVAEEGCVNVDKKELSGTHATSAAHESEILKIFKEGAQHVNENEIEREAQEKVVELEEAYQDENSKYAKVNGKHVSYDEENECKLEGTSSDSEQSESAKFNGAQVACMPVENDLKGEVIQDGNDVKLNSLVKNTEEPETQLEHQQNEKKHNAVQVPSAVNTVEPGALGGDHADGENGKFKDCNEVGLEETHNQVDAAQEVFLKASNKNMGDVQQRSRAENEDLECAAHEVCWKSQSSSHDPPETLRTVVTGNSNSDLCKRQRLESEKTKEREREYEKEQARKLEEEKEKEREREREKDRLAVERATREAHERALAEARERAERIAVERVTAEARQRALMEAREKAERASADALEKSLAEKALKEARLRAERAAVERATAEARERAVERALAEKATVDARQRAERLNPTSRDRSRKDNEAGDYFRMTDKEDSEIKLKTSSSSSSQRYADSSAYGEVDSPLRCKAKLERHQRTVERAAKALAEKNMRDILAQREQAERNRLAESLDADVRRWSTGKEGNLRALLSTLQYILGPESGWQPIPLTDVITAVAVKKAYRKATLYVHPDKLQQRGASIHQKYICEKVFDLLKEAWNRFNSEER